MKVADVLYYDQNYIPNWVLDYLVKVVVGWRVRQRWEMGKCPELCGWEEVWTVPVEHR